MYRTALASLLVPLLLAACGGKVVVDAAPGGAGGTGGAGPAEGGGGSGGTSSICGGWYFNLVVDGVASSLTSSCSYASPMAATPYGFVSPTGALYLQACASHSESSQGVSGFTDTEGGVTGPGTYQGGAFEYTGTDHMSSSDASGTLRVTISQLGPVGGLIDGSLQMSVLEGGATHNVQGTFALCRVQ